MCEGPRIDTVGGEARGAGSVKVSGQGSGTLRCCVKLRMIKRQERPGAVLWSKAWLMNRAMGKSMVETQRQIHMHAKRQSEKQMQTNLKRWTKM